MGFLSVPVLARELTAVKVEVSSVAVGSALGVRIELDAGNRCGAVLSFGDGSSQELMLEADAGASVTHQYSKAGNYAITVQGKTIWRGLGTYASCDGHLASAVRVEDSDGAVQPNQAERSRQALSRSTNSQTSVGTTQPQAKMQSVRRLALVIGNDNYSGDIKPLKNARNDARLVAGVLRNAGFEVSEASNLNRAALWSTLDRFKGQIQKGDEVVFYFAGHGVQVGPNQVLLPTDIRAENDSQVQRDGVPLIEVQDALRDARLAMLLVDACRDNPFPKVGTRTLGSTRGLLPPEAATGQIIMMSAGRNQKALDYVPESGQSNGLFAWELSQVLQIPGLEIRVALEEVKNRVDEKARRVGHEQRPSLVNDLRGPYVLLASGNDERVTLPTGVQVQQPVQQARIVTPALLPTTPTPIKATGISLEDLEKEEATRRQWADWQKAMKADFDKTNAFAGAADLQVKAWERFLANWAQDNPLSKDDEALRQRAQNELQNAQQVVAKNNAQRTLPASTQEPRTPVSVYFAPDSRSIGQTCNSSSDCAGDAWCPRNICAAREGIKSEFFAPASRSIGQTCNSNSDCAGDARCPRNICVAREGTNSTFSTTQSEQQAVQRVKEEVVAWESAKRANTEEGYAYFLAKFPEGRFSDLAQLNKRAKASSQQRCKELLRRQYAEYEQQHPAYKTKFVIVRGLPGQTNAVARSLSEFIGATISAGRDQDTAWNRDFIGNFSGCIAHRSDLGGSAEGSQCLVDMLGGGFYVGKCSTDGYPYNLRLMPP
jgi:uncharacterized caspase-like protein